MSRVEGAPPGSSVPAVRGDFNAIGLSGEPSDDCIYWLSSEQMGQAGATEGSVVFVYDDDDTDSGEPEVFGFICVIERVPWAADRFRGRPDKNTWYRGPKTWGGPNGT